MATIDVNKLKMGVTYVDDDGQPYKVMSFDFHKMGRGKANIKVKARNLMTGAIINKSYLSGGRVESADLTKTEMQYLYSDEEKLTLWILLAMSRLRSKKRCLAMIWSIWWRVRMCGW